MIKSQGSVVTTVEQSKYHFYLVKNKRSDVTRWKTKIDIFSLYSKDPCGASWPYQKEQKIPYHPPVLNLIKTLIIKVQYTISSSFKNLLFCSQDFGSLQHRSRILWI